MNIVARTLLYIAMAAMVAGCSNSARDETDRYDSGTLYLSCDESFKPVMDAQIDVFKHDYPKANIIANYKPEADCISDFIVDSVRMVIATRGFSPNEQRFINDTLKVGPEAETIAYDAIAVVVNPQATDSFFTIKDIADLLTGKSSRPLVPVFDGLKATSTVRFMIDSVLHGQGLGKNVVAAQTSQGVLDYVARTKNAVGFLGISWIGNSDDTVQLSYLKKIRLAHLESTDSVGGFVLPVQYLIYSRTYPLIRSLVYVLKEKNRGLAHSFAAFLRSDRGQLIFRRSYLLPGVRPFYSRQTDLR